jgi:hypothetical protein
LDAPAGIKNTVHTQEARVHHHNTLLIQATTQQPNYCYMSNMCMQAVPHLKDSSHHLAESTVEAGIAHHSNDGRVL